jgi:Tol biopolymer transport system component
MLDQLHGQSLPQPLYHASIFRNQPYVATVDLDGGNLQQIGPGMMPSWSPDGKTIVFTSVTVDHSFADPGKPRLCVMVSQGLRIDRETASGRRTAASHQIHLRETSF